METKNLLQALLQSNQTVFSFDDLLIMTGMEPKSLSDKLNYYTKKGYLHHIRRGLYSKDKNYNKFELANKLMIPSYISFETVLKSAGVIFQYYSQIFCASYRSKEIVCEDQIYIYKTIKDSILTNPTGLIINKNYAIATVERAFLDILYLNKSYYFDNLHTMNWDKVYEILPIYGNNRRMKKLVKMYNNYVTES